MYLCWEIVGRLLGDQNVHVGRIVCKRKKPKNVHVLGDCWEIVGRSKRACWENTWQMEKPKGVHRVSCVGRLKCTCWRISWSKQDVKSAHFKNPLLSELDEDAWTHLWILWPHCMRSIRQSYTNEIKSNEHTSRTKVMRTGHLVWISR